MSIGRAAAPPDWIDHLWQSRVLPTRTTPASYTTRPEWSSDGESMWMRLSKFSLFNRLSLHALAGLVAVRADEAFSEGVDVRRADRFVPARLTRILEIPEASTRDGFCLFNGHPALAWAATELRYCPACLELASTRRGFSGDSSNDALCMEVVCGEDAGNVACPSRICSTVAWQRIRCRAPAAVPAGSRRWIVPPDVALRSRAALPGSSDAGRPMSPARWCPSPPRRISLATRQPDGSYPSRRQESKSGWRAWPGICGC